MNQSSLSISLLHVYNINYALPPFQLPHMERQFRVDRSYFGDETLSENQPFPWYGGGDKKGLPSTQYDEVSVSYIILR